MIEEPRRATVLNVDQAARKSARFRTFRQLLTGLLLVLLPSCGSSEGLQVSGVVTYQGQESAAELSFERLNSDLKPTGRAITTNADASGRFQVQLPAGGESKFRIVIRVTDRPADGALPAGFDSLPLGTKTVELERSLVDGSHLTFALTR